MAKSKNGNGGAMSSGELQAKLVEAGIGKGVIAQFLKQYGPQIGQALLTMLLGFLEPKPTPPPVMMKAKKAECGPRECGEDEGFCAQMIAHAQVACLEGDHERCLQNLVCALHCSVQCCAAIEEESKEGGGSDEE